MAMDCKSVELYIAGHHFSPAITNVVRDKEKNPLQLTRDADPLSVLAAVPRGGCHSEHRRADDANQMYMQTPD